jgi:regulatory protein
MIKIEKIKIKKSSADITVNGEIITNVNLDALYNCKIQEGNISEKEYNNFIQENNKQNAKNKLVSSLIRKAKSEKESRIKLYQKGFPNYAVDFAIKFAKEYGYLNDEEYSKEYTDLNLKNKGALRIKYELKLKGVNEELINLSLIDKEMTQEENAEQLADKYMKGKETTQKNIEKLYRHLASRGYTYDIIKSAIKKYRDNVEYEDN